MEYGGTAGTDMMYCCGVTPSTTKKPPEVQGVAVTLLRDETFRKFDLLLHSKPRKDVTVRARVLAYLFVAPGWSADKKPMSGYGHLGCCMLLAIQQVKQINSDQVGTSIFEIAKGRQKRD